MNDLWIIGVESSCDDTSVAVLNNRKVCANVTANQQIHEQYGGVVPELASRAHQQNIVPTVDQALKKAGISRKQLQAVAYTEGPGLLGSLLVGTSFAKSLAMALQIPTLAVHHMEAHILAHFIEDETPIPNLPFLCLTVSGGHSQIVKVLAPGKYEMLGETQDDAAGEAFDKAARILDLPYPGGPLIDKYAREGNPHRFQFNKPQVPGYNYSFSGLKTSILYYLQKMVKAEPDFVKDNMYDLCASIQETIIDILMEKLERAAADTGISQIAIAGGVSANSRLRNRLQENEQKLQWSTYIPKFEYCTDNGAMIGIAGYYQYLNGNFSSISQPAQARKPFPATPNVNV